MIASSRKRRKISSSFFLLQLISFLIFPPRRPSLSPSRVDGWMAGWLDECKDYRFFLHLPACLPANGGMETKTTMMVEQDENDYTLLLLLFRILFFFSSIGAAPPLFMLALSNAR